MSDIDTSSPLTSRVMDNDSDTSSTISSSTITSSTSSMSPSTEYDTIGQLIEMIKVIGYGVRDSFKVPLAFKILLHSKTLKKLYYNCILLNGIIFLGSYLVYLYWVDPTLEYLLQQFPILSNIFSMIYCLLWVYPVYIFSMVLNSRWYTEIAAEAFRITGFKNTGGPTSVNRLLSGIVDEIYRNIMFGVFLLLSVVIAFIPYTSLINFVLVTWLYSFWCFEGRWTLMQRLTYFESHWAYMFGYGAVFTLTSFFFPVLIGNAIFALLYPMFIIMSVVAKPIKIVKKGPLPKQIPIFYIPEKIVNILLKTFVLKKNASSSSSSSKSNTAPSTQQ
ncbi:hypothetical protein SAMD00019534_114260 [Acytostelium subglobosum LB1]|uniref:hypothetical protein n=1 Tax=Acytostelium subglobosum LB1 TaxID=1410327 RepID=UPI000644B3E3|nr:hypothetical protein SAMD00019534_114260 [Acytostelium subglobosum LB1]GAM28250.1 hypothetical protein SAMD00019534_114260 [Acytostelium subglobosum LB1]|eukprot:XP_012748884.1 hypothetical protein SAMD00019534_114260 [Acytostelium subglobosum LB1]